MLAMVGDISIKYCKAKHQNFPHQTFQPHFPNQKFQISQKNSAIFGRSNPSSQASTQRSKRHPRHAGGNANHGWRGRRGSTLLWCQGASVLLKYPKPSHLLGCPSQEVLVKG